MAKVKLVPVEDAEIRSFTIHLRTTEYAELVALTAEAYGTSIEDATPRRVGQIVAQLVKAQGVEDKQTEAAHAFILNDGAPTTGRKRGAKAKDEATEPANVTQLPKAKSA